MLKAKRAEREAKELNEAEEIARRIGKSKMVFTLETGETGKAFGSVTANDIATRLKNEIGVEIDRHRLVLEHPIKSTGEHEISIKLHHDVTAILKFTVKSATEPKPEANDDAESDPLVPHANATPSNKCREIPKGVILRGLARQRRMALTEARRRGTAKKLIAPSRQLPHRMLVGRCRTASRRSKACSVPCSSRRAISSRNASRKLTKSISTSRRTRSFIPRWWSSGPPARAST